MAENGAGKTTFLHLLLGEVAPDRGTITLEPSGARVCLCAQEVERPGPEVIALGARSDGQARALWGQLALDPAVLARWGVLSPGERKRWQVAAALAGDPDVLLLDEPTNHLDPTARERVLQAVAGHRGLGIVVSHDRTFLERLTDQTLRLERGKVSLIPAPYARARTIWEGERRHRDEQRRRAQQEVRRLEQRLDGVRRRQGSADRARSAGHRMKDRHDHDARSIGAQMHADWAQDRVGREVGVVRAELDRARTQVPEGIDPRELGGAVFARYEPARRPILLSLSTPSLEVAGRSLARDVNVVLRRQDRVWLAGDNGAGKSTLVQALMAASSLPHGKLLWVPQELTADEGRALLDDVRSAPAEVRGRVLSVVAALGADPGRLLASRRPSPGEARKLAIALGLGRHVWALVLDEPTNHLDLPSVERVERALCAFPGALLLVTHDETLGARCTSTRWRLHDGRLIHGEGAPDAAGPD